MVNDIRENDASKYAFTKGFDTFSYKKRLIPYRSYEAGQDTVNRKINKFLYYNGKLYGRGFVSATPSVYDTQVYYKTVFSDGTWTTPANGGDASSAAIDAEGYGELFIYYKGYIYGASSSTSVFKFDVAESVAFANNNFNENNVGNVQGVIHSADDILYVAAKNATTLRATIWKNDNGTWAGGTDTVSLTLPANMSVTSMCEYGIYLAIACVSDDPLTTSSKVFLWDRVATTWNESIDWGEGSLNVLEELEGRLIGISIQERVNATNLLFNTTINFKYYAGAQGAIEFDRLTGLTAATPVSYLGKAKQKANNRIYFATIISTPEGTATREGVWSVGPNKQGGYSIVNEYQSSDATIPTAIDGFFLMGSYIFIAYSNSGSLSGNISKTRDDEVYSNNSVYESIAFDGGDSSLTKKLIGVTVHTVAIPSGGSIVLKYKIDEVISTSGGAFTTIFTNATVTAGSFTVGATYTIVSVGTTDFTAIGASANTVGVTFIASGAGSGSGVAVPGLTSHSAINIESSGATLSEFKEVQFQIISTGGAIVTGLSFAYEITGKRLY